MFNLVIIVKNIKFCFKMLNIQFKDYFWGKCDDLHERYIQKKITQLNILEIFSNIYEGMSNYLKCIEPLILNNKILYPEKEASKYHAMEMIKIILTSQSHQLNEGIKIIKNKILKGIKTEKEIKEEKIKEKELYSLYKKNILRYSEEKNNLIKNKEKYFNAVNTAKNAIYDLKKYELQQNKNLNNNNNNDTLKEELEMKYNKNLIEARKYSEKYNENIKEINNIRELTNNIQNELLQFYENVENQEHNTYILILKDYYSYLKTENSVMKENLMKFEEKINLIDDNNDIIALINLYGSSEKPLKPIKLSQYKFEIDLDNYIQKEELILEYNIMMNMKSFIKEFCPNYDFNYEEKKQDMRILCEKIVENNGKNLDENDKNKIDNYINEEWGQNYFLFFLNKIRAIRDYSLDEKLIKFIAYILNKILNFEKKSEKLDYSLISACIIISQTYYYIDKNNSKKIYLSEFLVDNKWFIEPNFWRNIIERMISNDINELKKTKDNNINDEQCIINRVFGQILSFVKNMKDFKIDNKIIIQIVDEFVTKYNINEEFKKNIYDYILNEKEKEK